MALTFGVQFYVWLALVTYLVIWYVLLTDRIIMLSFNILFWWKEFGAWFPYLELLSACLNFEYTVETGSQNHGGQKQPPLAFVAAHRDFVFTMVFHNVSKHALAHLIIKLNYYLQSLLDAKYHLEMK